MKAIERPAAAEAFGADHGRAKVFEQRLDG
jgi:hypothetical protein